MEQRDNNRWKTHASPEASRLTIGALDHGIPFEFDSSENFRAGVAEVTRERDVNVLYFEGGMLQDPLGFESQVNMLYDLVSPENAPVQPPLPAPTLARDLQRHDTLNTHETRKRRVGNIRL